VVELQRDFPLERVNSPLSLDTSSRCQYVILTEIKTAKRFSLVVDCVALGSSFCMAARMVQLVRGESGLAIYSGCSELVTSNYTRVARAVC
jgi:hypothetical protein